MDAVTRTQHYREAERLLDLAANLASDTVGHAAKVGHAQVGDMMVLTAHAANIVAAARVHALLAQAPHEVAVSAVAQESKEREAND